MMKSAVNFGFGHIHWKELLMENLSVLMSRGIAKAPEKVLSLKVFSFENDN